MNPGIRYLCDFMAKFTRVSTASLLLTVLIGCAAKNTPTQQFYTLQSLDSDKRPSQGSVGVSEPELIFTRVTVPSYLNQTGIITADIDGKIEWANYHLWAELPAVAIKRYLERCVLNDASSERRQQRIDIEIHRFQGDGKGGVIFDGIWSKHNVDDGTALGTYIFEYRQPQRGDGYGPLATALSQTVEQLCIDIQNKTL